MGKSLLEARVRYDVQAVSTVLTSAECDTTTELYSGHNTTLSGTAVAERSTLTQATATPTAAVRKAKISAHRMTWGLARGVFHPLGVRPDVGIRPRKP